MRVLHLISSGGMYGAENVVGALARDLEELGCWVRVGVFQNEHCPPNSVADQLEQRGVRLTRIVCRGRMDRAATQQIRELIGSEHIQLVHSHGYKSDLYAYAATRRMQLPRVATCHLWTRQTAAIRLYEFIDALLLRRFDAVVAVSGAIAEELRRAGISAAKINTIDNGIDLAPFASAQPSLGQEIAKGERLLIGTVGRMVAQKGMDYFLRAAREVLNETPQAMFAIVGEGPDREKLERLANELGIAGQIVFTGARADMPQVYASLDVFVLASLDEGMPMALLEALASSRAVVATQVGAVPKLIVPGQTGMLVPAADVKALADAILVLLRNPDLRARLGRNGGALVQKQFSSRVMSQQYLRLYEQLLSPAGLRPNSPSLMGKV
ncbi:MAG: glycosyltransferase family 4 protein [Terriglobales bacterium]